MRTGKIDALESLRGIAALLVVFFHMPKWHPMLDNALFNNAYLMVELFFVLSGFVIFTAYGDSLRTGREVLRFQWLRFARLYPVHLLFLLVFLAFEVVKAVALSRPGMEANSAAFAENDLRAFVENLLLLNGALPDRPFTFNYPAWSISVEFWTYLIYALVILWLRPWRIAALALLAGGALLLLALGTTGGFDNLLKCIAGFALGCLLAIWRRTGVSLQGWTPLAAMAALIGYLLLKPPHEQDLWVFPLSVLLVLTVTAAEEGWSTRQLRARGLVWLGTISYALYMAHASVLWVANQAVRILSDRPEAADADGRMIPQLAAAPTLAVAAAVLVVLLGVSVAVHVWLERPLRERSRRVGWMRREERAATAPF